MRVQLVPKTVRNQPVDEHTFQVCPDRLVGEAKALRAQGLSHRAIADRLGIHHSTAWRWVAGITREPAVRVMVRRVRSKQFVTDHQSSQKPISSQRLIFGCIQRYRQSYRHRTNMTPSNRKKPLNLVMNFGKYKGTSVAWIAAHDPKYLMWIGSLHAVRNSPELWSSVREQLLKILQTDLDQDRFADLA